MTRLVEGGGWWRTNLVRSAAYRFLPTHSPALPHRSLSTYAGAISYTLVNPFTIDPAKLGFLRWYIVSLVIPPGFGSAAFVLTGQPGTQPYVTTIGVDLSAAAGDFVAAANSAFVAYAQTVMPQTSSALVLDHVTLSVGQDGPGGSVDSTAAPVAGTRTGSFPPTAMSCIARKSTNELGRRGRGRMFIPAILSEGEVDEDGTIVAARRTAANTMLTSFFNALDIGWSASEVALPPVLLHGPSASPLEPTPISGLTVSDTVGWIRGRIR